jgi:hypothetical protein
MPPKAYSVGRPLQPTQAVKERAPRPKLSKEAQAALRAQQQSKGKAYNLALDDANKAINDIIENVAVTHKKSLQRVESTLHMGRDPITNQQRSKSTAWNGFARRKVKELRDQGIGEFATAYKIILLTVAYQR